MKQSLMTPSELTERLATGEDHLELSIEKHKRARLKKNWDELCGDLCKHYSDETCALCVKYAKGDSCKGCPLKPWFFKRGCGGNSIWAKATDAIYEADRPAFMRHSRALIIEMEGAL